MFGKPMMVLGEKKKDSIWEQHETKLKRTFLFRKNNVSCSARLCSHKQRIEDICTQDVCDYSCLRFSPG